MTIGQRIKARREELGMSQEELAFKIGYRSRSSINKIELDVQQLTQRKIRAIADALNVTANYILGISDDDMPIPCELYNICYDVGGCDLVQKFSMLDADDRQDIIDLIDSKLSRDKYKNSEV